MGGLVAIVDVSAAMREKNRFFECLQSSAASLASLVRTLDFDEATFRNILHTKEDTNDEWRREPDFSVSFQKILAFSTRLGFTLDYVGDIAIVLFPCNWRSFCTKRDWNNAFRNCAHEIGKVIGSTGIIYFESESDASVGLDLIYDGEVEQDLSISLVLNTLRTACGDPLPDINFENQIGDKKIVNGYFMDFVGVKSL